MKMTSKIWRGNNRGVGFATIPKKYERMFDKNETVKVSGADIAPLFAKIKIHKKRSGVYIPKETCSGLIGKKIDVVFEKVGGFHSTLGSDGRLYIPNHLAGKFKLAGNDIVLIRGTINGHTKEKACLVKKRERGAKREDMVMFDSKLSGSSGIFNIMRKLPKTIKCSKFVKSAISDFNCGQIDKNKIILYFGKMNPLVINPNFESSALPYFLGAYFSDGMKKGFNWGITASTFEQARFYVGMHRKLILNSEVSAFVTFTSRVKNDTVRKDLTRKWSRVVDIDLNYKKVRLVKTKVKFAPNRNKNGSLTIREGKQALLLYYNRLVKTLLIDMKQNPAIGFDFLCGVLEGDGCANARKRGHISIASNRVEKNVIAYVLNILDMKYNTYKEEKNKYTIRIGALELIKNLPILKDKIFKYYPKRRKKFIERFCNVGAVRFILGRQLKASAWVKTYLRKNDILNKEYGLAPYGMKVRKCLKEMLKEIGETACKQ